MLVVLGPAPAVPGEPPAPDGWAALALPDDAGAPDAEPRLVARFRREEAAAVVRWIPGELAVEPGAVRWVLASVADEYPRWLAAGVQVDRCWDLGLVQRILTRAAAAPGSGLGPGDGPSGARAGYAPVCEIRVAEPEDPAAPPRRDPAQDAFFDLPDSVETGPDVHALTAELRAQHAAVAGSAHPHRLRLLVAAESQGALVAAEIRAAGLPWSRPVHEALLADQLGPRPPEGQRPARLQALAERIGDALGSPGVSPDSQPSLLRALQTAGVTVESTRQWDLKRWIEQGGPQRQERATLLAPLLEYKALARLWTANGWHWLDEWVGDDGRFHATYLVGGVVTGRWAAHGGGAMQVPSVVRDAVRADPGWLLTVADASQVEPRILAAMARDEALALAGTTPDLYREVAEQGRAAGTALADRARAKVALLGAMYGATTGDSAALMPHLRRLYPAAIGLLERAASVGEAGGQVATWLGRWSPAPDEAWLESVADVSTEAAESAARRRRRSAGRFTRNFVVQGTAAEWALCWMGEIRRRLRAEGMVTELVFFVHDEVVLHGPAEEAEAVRAAVAQAATAAGRLLFGQAPVDFPLTVSSISSYADAK